MSERATGSEAGSNGADPRGGKRWSQGVCSLQDGVLEVCGPLDRTQWASFEEGCALLLDTQAWRQVRIDLTRCRYLSSLFIGHLVGTYKQIEKEGRTVRLVVSEEVARFLDLAFLNEVMAYEVVKPPAPASRKGSASLPPARDNR